MEQNAVNPEIIARGVIQGPEAGGEVVISTSAQGEMLHLENYWIAQGAPDVRIYLSPDETGNVDVAGAVDFGRPALLSGSTSYAIPQDHPARQMRSVVVYCKVYSVTFGVAVLEAS